MKERLHYFFLCAIFLCAEINYCLGSSGVVYFHESQYSNTETSFSERKILNIIQSNNWLSRELDVKELITRIKSDSDISECTPTKFVIENNSLIFAIERGQFFDPDFDNLSDVIGKLCEPGKSISEYIIFANTLALFGVDEDIIKAAYDIARAVMQKIMAYNPYLRNYIGNELRLTENTSKTVLKNFRKAYTTDNKALLEAIRKSQRHTIFTSAVQIHKDNKAFFGNSKNIDNSKVEKYNKGQPKALKNMIKKYT